MIVSDTVCKDESIQTYCCLVPSFDGCRSFDMRGAMKIAKACLVSNTKSARVQAVGWNLKVYVAQSSTMVFGLRFIQPQDGEAVRADG